MPFWDKLESDWTFTGEDYEIGIGSDKSHRYMKNKKSVLYIASDENTQRVIGLKPFIESFKLDIKMKINETEGVYTGRKFKAPINMGATYSLTLTIPAASINEARMNKRKLDLLPKFLENFSDGSRVLTPKSHFLYLNNLIHNGKRVSGDKFVMNKDEETTYENLRKYACRGYITEANYNIVSEDGFFEYDEKLFPKTYKTTITFIAFNEQRNTNNTTTHYLTDGYINIAGDTNLEIGSWPFGVEVTNVKKSKIQVNDFGFNFLTNEGYGYDHHYSLAKNSYIYIFPASVSLASTWLTETSTPRLVVFKPYVESVSFSRKTTKNETFSSFKRSDFFGFPAEDASYDLSFNVIAENVNESIAMHAKFQELTKMISPTSEPTFTGATTRETTVTDEAGSPKTITEIVPATSVIKEKKQENFIRLLFSNVIFNKYNFKDSEDPANAAGTNINDIFKTNFNVSTFKSYTDYYSAAAPFNLTEISYDPFVDMGFFEFNGMLWPKGYKLSLKLTENYETNQKEIIYELYKGETIKAVREGE